ncbi:MAG TPA: hypothetical protein PKE04_15555, partial [Clostridia bacterium]|nr:hypothetical protein [Clostridia bacterium]
MRYVRSSRNRQITDFLPVLGERNNLGIDKACAFLLAICPILQHYRGVYNNASSVILILLLPYVFFRFLGKNTRRFAVVLPLVLSGLFETVNHGVTFAKFGREGLLICYFIVALSGVVNVRQFLKVSTYITIAASAVIMLQYACYYVLGFHLKLVPTNLLLDSAEQWIRLAQTGRISVTGAYMDFYRPSAFFLEPSHLALYCCPPIAFLLLSPGMDRWRFRMAILVTLGVFLSTSGLGMAIATAVWLLY